VCGVGGHKVLGLLKKLKVEKRFFDLLFKITGNRPSKVSTDKNYEILSLPHEFQQLSSSSSNNPEARNALSYLKKRGLTTQDILKYNIGYCEKGKYGGMIIIPSYDEEGNLNFFTGRSYYDVNFKHLNPTVSKDIIGFDLFVNWNEPITIVEGAFDAIAVKRNSIPLFGKLILDKLKIKILEKGVKRINIALDRDAMKNAIAMAEYFNGRGISVYFVELPEKDPSELGFEKITGIIDNVERLTPKKLLEYKIDAY
tara:strand:+ start:181 stop:945 length:765 start_codon:yes stop_codon:yes gene_type:complete